jgi:CHAT domain-containing protein
MLPKLLKILKKVYRKRSLFLAFLLFILTATLPTIVPSVTAATSSQTQPDTTQLATQAKKSYLNARFDEAVMLWQKAAKAFGDRGDRLNQAMALSNLSLTYQQIGQWDKAQNAISQSLKILNERSEEEAVKLLAQSWDIQGSLQREIGKSSDALDSWRQATKLYEQVKETEKVAQSKINQVQAMQDLGLYPRACKTLLDVLSSNLEVQTCQELTQLSSENLTQKLKKIETISQSPTKVIALKSLGELLRFIGQLEQSKPILETSLRLAQKLNSPQDLAATYLSFGNTVQALSEGEKVRRRREDYQQQALEAYRQVEKLSTSPTMQQQAQLNQLSLLVKLQEFSEAESLWRSLNTRLNNLPPSRTGVYLQLNFARSLVNLTQKEEESLRNNAQLPTFEEIDRILIKAGKQAQTIGDRRAEAYTLGSRGTLYENKDAPKAQQLTQQALTLASSFEVPDIAYQFSWQLGRIRKAQDDIPGAIASYSKAYNALQSLRSDLVALNPEVQFSFRDSVEPVYRQLVELDLEYAKTLKQQKKEKESQERLSQARSVIESLQLAEINNFFREACVETSSKQIDQIDRTAAVIYPIILGDRLDVLVSISDRPLSLYTNQIPQAELEGIIDNVRRSLIDPQSSIEQFSPIYQQLYDLLIRPLETELANNKIKTLVFVLDGDLRNLPMSVLFDGKQYLVEKYAIALTPGLQLLNPRPLADIQLNALIAGLSEIRTDFDAHQGFAPLLNVPDELAQIKSVGLANQSLLNQQFTRNKLKQEIVDFRFPIVHLATHAQFSSNIDETFILSWDGRINVKQLDSLLRDDSLEQPRPIELLVLSACETASGDKRATLGLAGVAIRAGARSTLATLWSVVDDSTAKMMSVFYRQLEQSKQVRINKAEALRQAQLTLIKDKQYGHPHFWAPFVLIGNWQ